MRTANRPQIWCRRCHDALRLRLAGEQRINTGSVGDFVAAAANCARAELQFLQSRRADEKAKRRDVETRSYAKLSE